jgi:catechol 2,3-dioxygenase-like lactoylglutathione lyase family enzyme
MPEHLPIDHVAITSKDMEADIAFYWRLGFRVEARYPDWAMMRDREGRGLALLAPEGKHPPHFALRAASRQEVEELARQQNCEIVEHRDGCLSAYLRDPSGNPIEIVFYPEK